jgi:hypothetical protein
MQIAIFSSFVQLVFKTKMASNVNGKFTEEPCKNPTALWVRGSSLMGEWCFTLSPSVRSMTLSLKGSRSAQLYL